jgi:hemerythrin-like metal-binding protein
VSDKAAFDPPLLGLALLDVDHRLLFGLLEDLAGLASEGATALLLEDAALELAQAVESHFTREERMMAEIKDPGLEAHASAHGLIFSRIERLTGAVMSKLGAKGARREIEALALAMAEEIRSEDAASAPYLAKLSK